LAAIDVDNQPAKEGEETLSKRQMADSAVAKIIQFLEDGSTPENDHKTEKLHSLWYSMKFLMVFCTILNLIRIALPLADRKKVFIEAHSGVFGTHLQEATIHRQLAKHYSGHKCMPINIATWCCKCSICAYHSVGHATKPNLTPNSCGRPI